MVVYPQAEELSTGRPQIAKNPLQGTPQANRQPPPRQKRHIHTSTTPYYD